MHHLKTLEALLKPPGKGIYAVSTGRGLADSLLKLIYKTSQETRVRIQWLSALRKIKRAQGVLIACPSDIGASVVRGTNMGPLEIRKKIYQNNLFKKWIRTGVLVDAGDIFVVPQLLEDEILTSKQISKNRAFLYKGKKLPVSPLSILKKVSDLIYKINPNVKLITLGGDHSISYPLVKSLKETGRKPFAILHFDAHTDLLKTRLGIDHCFGTWAYHANDLVGRKKRLVQVGIRASGKTKHHWESTLDVKQFWASQVRKNPKQITKHILDHLRKLNLKDIYISNDVDATGMEYAAATGTPEPHGLHPQFVEALIRAVGDEFNVIGADLVEVAPVLHADKPDEPQKTLRVASTYTCTMIQAMLPSRL